MAAAAIAAKAAMMNSGEAVEERTDEELLAEVRTHPTLLSRGLVCNADLAAPHTLPGWGFVLLNRPWLRIVSKFVRMHEYLSKISYLRIIHPATR